MSFSEDLDRIHTLFIDTAPIIYFIEAHPQFGPLVREVVSAFRTGRLTAYSSVITLTEVYPKPIQADDEALARKFVEFLKYGRNLSLIEISAGMAERAGRLRGRYPHLKTVDALQIASAIEIRADAFLTNDKKLRQVKEIKVVVLKDYL
ncbi:MAG: PIN domain-containing protein [Nitrospirae bacterium]|nr:PIN domain-containing protein [Nitrospirota bacterium]